MPLGAIPGRAPRAGLPGGRASAGDVAQVLTDVLVLGHDKRVPPKVVATRMGHTKVSDQRSDSEHRNAEAVFETENVCPKPDVQRPPRRSISRAPEGKKRATNGGAGARAVGESRTTPSFFDSGRCPSIRLPAKIVQAQRVAQK
jgi:hypothetical protein